MVRFLINRPVAVIMAFLAFLLLGIAAYFTLPVSLLPNIPIPSMTVQVTGKNMSARELENTVVKPIRQSLIQLSSLKDLESEVRDEDGLLHLSFKYGVNTNLAYIEVNEKIDGVMGTLPRSVSRPRVVKASATDIPVFQINLTFRKDSAFGSINEKRFLELSAFSETVLKRRLEQLPQVAMVDLTGCMKQQVSIIPDDRRLKMADLSYSDLKNCLKNNNVEPISLRVRDGSFQYKVCFSSLLRTIEDVKNVQIFKNGQIYRLSDFAEVRLSKQKEKGFSFYNGKRAITLAVIKQSDENMDELKLFVDKILQEYRETFPNIEFSVSQNQTELLDYTIRNLQQNLIIGFLLICLVAFIFLGDRLSPIVISISMIVSLIISLLFFFFFGLSLNIISLSGLILALGMMIDSSIIVTDNITQYREKYGVARLDDACVKGTNEIIFPVLSSSLTTVAVFAPLVFMSGITGAIFEDEALSVTIGLFVSYLIGILLLPVLYKVLYRYKKEVRTTTEKRPSFYMIAYDKGVDYVFRHKLFFSIITLLCLPLCFLLFTEIKKEKMPAVEQTEMWVAIDWNTNIHLDENLTRVNHLIKALEPAPLEHSCLLAHQDFLLNRERERDLSESDLYLRAKGYPEIHSLQQQISAFMKVHYPDAVFSFRPPENLFEKIFADKDGDLLIELVQTGQQDVVTPDSIRRLENLFSELSNEAIEKTAFSQQLNISIKREKLLYYNVAESSIKELLETAFHVHQFATLRSYQHYLPMLMSGQKKCLEEVLNHSMVDVFVGGKTETVPLSAFIQVETAADLKQIVASRNGEYLPFRITKTEHAERIIERVQKEFKQNESWDVFFSGAFFDNEKMFDELVLILLVSLLMMYFILAAQFESLVQPFIVLLEIPIDVAAALLILWLCGHSLNLMSAIGIVVTCGIVINDSILKIDVMNSLRKQGVPLIEAIHLAGHKRLRAIIMTSLTTILAMTPLLFSDDLGAELQKPLAIAMIGSMVLGTLVSLFIIPLAYWMIYRNKTN